MKYSLNDKIYFNEKEYGKILEIKKINQDSRQFLITLPENFKKFITYFTSINISFNGMWHNKKPT